MQPKNKLTLSDLDDLYKYIVKFFESSDLSLRESIRIKITELADEPNRVQNPMHSDSDIENKDITGIVLNKNSGKICIKLTPRNGESDSFQEEFLNNWLKSAPDDLKASTLGK